MSEMPGPVLPGCDDGELPHCVLIENNYEDLCSAIYPDRYFPKFRQEHVFSPEDEEEISNGYIHHTRQQKAAHFLDILKTKGHDACITFLSVLEFENPPLYEKITKKKARPTPQGQLLRNRTSVLIPHLAHIVQSLEQQYQEKTDLKENVTEMTLLIDKINQDNQRLETENEDLKRRLHDKHETQKKNTRLKRDVQHLLKEAEKMRRENESNLKRCLEFKKEKDDAGNRYQHCMLERDIANEKYNKLKEERDAIRIRASKLQGDYENERKKSMHLQKASQRAPRIGDVKKLEVENQVLKQQVMKLETKQGTVASPQECQGLQKELCNRLRVQMDVLQEKIQEMTENCEQYAQELYKTQQELHDLEEEKLKLDENWSELEVEAVSLRNEKDSYKLQSQEIKEQINTIKAERDQAISERNKSQQNCEVRTKERDKLLEQKHKLQEDIEELKSEITALKREHHRLKRYTKQLKAEPERYSGDSNNMELEMTFSDEESLSLSSDSSLEKKNRPHSDPEDMNLSRKLSTQAQPSASIKKRQPRYLEDEQSLLRHYSLLDRLSVYSTDDDVRLSEPQEHEDLTSSNFGSFNRNTSSDDGVVARRGVNDPIYDNVVFDNRCGLETCRTSQFRFSRSDNVREVYIPAEQVQNFVEIRGEKGIGIFVVCVNSKVCGDYIQQKDQILKLSICNKNDLPESLDFTDSISANWEKARLMIMCAKPNTGIYLALKYNPRGYQWLQEISEKYKIVEDPFFIRSNVRIDNKREGHLPVEQKSVFLVLHTAVPVRDKHGRPCYDSSGAPKYDWFASKIDEHTGEKIAFGLIPNEKKARKFLPRQRTADSDGGRSPFPFFGNRSRSVGAITYSIPGLCSMPTDNQIAYSRIKCRKYKKVIALFGPPYLVDIVYSKLVSLSESPFKQCKTELVSCSDDVIGDQIMGNQVVYYKKLDDTANFELITTKTVKHVAQDYYCLANIPVKDMESFTSRLRFVGLDVTVVYLRPPAISTPGTLWYDMSQSRDDLIEQIKMADEAEKKLLYYHQSYDAIPMASPDVKDLKCLVAEILRICEREPNTIAWENEE